MPNPTLLFTSLLDKWHLWKNLAFHPQDFQFSRWISPFSPSSVIKGEKDPWDDEMTQKQRKRRLWGISQNVIALLSPALPIPFSHQGPSTRGDAQRFVSTVIDLVGRLIQLFPAEGNVVLYGGCEWAGVTIFGPTDGYNVVVMTYRAFLLAFFKSVCVFSSQNVCSFSLNLCGLKFSFPPVCPFVLPDNSFTLLFHHVHIQLFWELCWVTAGDNPTFSDFAKSFKLLHDRRFLSWKMYRKWIFF